MAGKIKYVKPGLCTVDSKPDSTLCVNGSGASGTDQTAVNGETVICSAGLDAEFNVPDACYSGLATFNCNQGSAVTGTLTCHSGQGNASEWSIFSNGECTSGAQHTASDPNIPTGACSTGSGPL